MGCGHHVGGVTIIYTMDDFSSMSAQELVKKKDEIEQNIKELLQILNTVCYNDTSIIV